jgi:peptidyl-prolyl cis-trans isomerase B (cyclophilin B)
MPNTIQRNIVIQDSLSTRVSKSLFCITFLLAMLSACQQQETTETTANTSDTEAVVTEAVTTAEDTMQTSIDTIVENITEDNQETTMSDTSTILLSTSLGDITIELDHKNAPESAKNFEAYVAAGHYDGVIFHRVIPNFMIQGGGFAIGMQQKPTQATIVNEADNGLKNMKYTLAMARTNEPHSASSQFFINTNDNDFLNHTATTPQGWGYAVFGKVTDGFDVVDQIGTVQTGQQGPHGDVPVTDVVIVSAKKL